jgi:hypothetical protein
MLRFNDGISIDTDGPLRPLRLKDGEYDVDCDDLEVINDVS